MELPYTIFFIKCFLCLLADFNKVGNILTVIKVKIKIVLEMLNEIHLMLNKLVPSYS